MALQTEEEIQAEVDALDVSIKALTDSPNDLINYTIAGRTFDKTKRLELLMKRREDLMGMLKSLPVEETTEFDDPVVNDTPRE